MICRHERVWVGCWVLTSPPSLQQACCELELNPSGELKNVGESQGMGTAVVHVCAKVHAMFCLWRRQGTANVPWRVYGICRDFER